jgi:hypothetical protein
VWFRTGRSDLLRCASASICVRSGSHAAIQGYTSASGQKLATSQLGANVSFLSTAS